MWLINFNGTPATNKLQRQASQLMVEIGLSLFVDTGKVPAVLQTINSGMPISAVSNSDKSIAPPNHRNGLMREYYLCSIL
jgi:hypothetical protein